MADRLISWYKPTDIPVFMTVDGWIKLMREETGGSVLLLLVVYCKWPLIDKLMSDRADLPSAHGSLSCKCIQNTHTHTFIIGHKNLTPQTKSYILPNSSSPTTIPLHLISIVDINPYLHPISWNYHLSPSLYHSFQWRPKDEWARASDPFIIKYLLSHHMK